MVLPRSKDIYTCQKEFEASGFRASRPYGNLSENLDTATKQNCLANINVECNNEITIVELLSLYPDVGIQSWGKVSERMKYDNCVDDAIRSHVDPKIINSATLETWQLFAEEANKLADASLGRSLGTRSSLMDHILSKSLAEASFDFKPAARASLRQWHPNSNRVDAAYHIFKNSHIAVYVTIETMRPLKHKFYPGLPEEPEINDDFFDKIEVNLWAIPTRPFKIPATPPWSFDFETIAIKINRLISFSYARFYSVKGAERIIQSRLTEAKIMMQWSE
jgi:hypothetical protein